jgi:hypothetical protein
MLNSLLGIGVIYVIVGIGLLEIGLWSLVHFGRELFRVVGLLSRTLPVLLILVLFLLFSSEIWEAAHGLAGVELVAILVLVTAIAVALVLTGVRSELTGVPAIDWPTLEAQAAQTPAAPLLDLPRDPAQPMPTLSFLQRVNVTSLLVIGQLIQSFFVALTVMAFLIVFSLIALPGELQARWIGEPVAVIVAFDLLGELRTLSFELVVVTAILARGGRALLHGARRQRRRVPAGPFRAPHGRGATADRRLGGLSLTPAHEQPMNPGPHGPGMHC